MHSEVRLSEPSSAVEIKTSDRNSVALSFGRIASEAGDIIMKFYSSPAPTEKKADGSPVSEADRAAEEKIRARLGALFPGVPIIAEESFDLAAANRVGDRFILVDPLDGTREFINHRDEFTVNIALIEDGVPVAGCVYAPALDRMYLGGEEAFRVELTPGSPLPDISELQRLQTKPYDPKGFRAVASRSHLDPETEGFLAAVPTYERRQAGSSLKFCLIAEGEADVYPRFGPTMEWDTAAGHAVLTAAGGTVVAGAGTPLRYRKAEAGFRNPAFVAWGKAPWSAKT